MKPIPPEILKFVPVIIRAMIPPANANGTFRRTRSTSLTFLNKIRRIMKMMRMTVRKKKKLMKVKICFVRNE